MWRFDTGDELYSDLRVVGRISGILTPAILLFALGPLYFAQSDLSYPVKGTLEYRIDFDGADSEIAVRSEGPCEVHCAWVGFYVVAKRAPLPSHKRPIFRASGVAGMRVFKVNEERIEISYDVADIDIYRDYVSIGREQGAVITFRYVSN